MKNKNCYKVRCLLCSLSFMIVCALALVGIFSFAPYATAEGQADDPVCTYQEAVFGAANDIGMMAGGVIANRVFLQTLGARGEWTYMFSCPDCIDGVACDADCSYVDTVVLTFGDDIRANLRLISHNYDGTYSVVTLASMVLSEGGDIITEFVPNNTFSPAAGAHVPRELGATFRVRQELLPNDTSDRIALGLNADGALVVDFDLQVNRVALSVVRNQVVVSRPFNGEFSVYPIGTDLHNPQILNDYVLFSEALPYWQNTRDIMEISFNFIHDTRPYLDSANTVFAVGRHIARLRLSLTMAGGTYICPHARDASLGERVGNFMWYDGTSGAMYIDFTQAEIKPLEIDLFGGNLGEVLGDLSFFDFTYDDLVSHIQGLSVDAMQFNPLIPADVWERADLQFVGKSLIQVGGHDFLEVGTYDVFWQVSYQENFKFLRLGTIVIERHMFTQSDITAGVVVDDVFYENVTYDGFEILVAFRATVNGFWFIQEFDDVFFDIGGQFVANTPQMAGNYTVRVNVNNRNVFTDGFLEKAFNIGAYLINSVALANTLPSLYQRFFDCPTQIIINYARLLLGLDVISLDCGDHCAYDCVYCCDADLPLVLTSLIGGLFVNVGGNRINMANAADFSGQLTTGDHVVEIGVGQSNISMTTVTLLNPLRIVADEITAQDVVSFANSGEQYTGQAKSPVVILSRGDRQIDITDFVAIAAAGGGELINAGTYSLTITSSGDMVCFVIAGDSLTLDFYIARRGVTVTLFNVYDAVFDGTAQTMPFPETDLPSYAIEWSIYRMVDVGGGVLIRDVERINEAVYAGVYVFVLRVLEGVAANFTFVEAYAYLWINSVDVEVSVIRAADGFLTVVADSPVPVDLQFRIDRGDWILGSALSMGGQTVYGARFSVSNFADALVEIRVVDEDLAGSFNIVRHAIIGGRHVLVTASFIESRAPSTYTPFIVVGVIAIVLIIVGIAFVIRKQREDARFMEAKRDLVAQGKISADLLQPVQRVERPQKQQKERREQPQRQQVQRQPQARQQVQRQQQPRQPKR